MNKHHFSKSMLYVVAIAFVAFMASCGGSGEQASSGNQKSATKDQVVKTDTSKTTHSATKETAEKMNIVDNPSYDNIAHFLAGMKVDPKSPYAKMEKDSTWISYASTFNKEWSHMEKKRLQPMTKWSETELADEHKVNPNIFYPLSGPDILHANVFFPHAKEYHMYALERAGALPDLSHMKPEEVKSYLHEINRSLSDIFKKSYFITHKMDSDLKRNNVNGTLPLMCIFLVRTNHHIVNVKYFHLNDDGSETALSSVKNAVHDNDFVKVYFEDIGSKDIQTVSYMRCDLSDSKLVKNKGMMAFLHNMPVSITYLKSASYLLHYKFFSILRKAILDKSQTVLEDDTGIPYHYFDKNNWTLAYYGKYVKPVRNFKGVFQPDLQKAYEDSAKYVKKLPFSLGYHWGTHDQNLLKAVKKQKA